MSEPQYPATPPTSPLPAPSGIPAPVGQWQVPTAGAAGPPDAELPAPALAGPPTGRGRGIVAVVAAVALIGAGAYASAQLLDDDRGAASPEAAGERLLEAIEDEDLIGVIDLLPPGEQQVLLDVTSELSEAGEELGLLGDTFRLDGFTGVDIEITDPELEVDEIGDGIATVTVVDGTVTAEVDGDEVVGSLGEVVEAIAEGNGEELEADDVEEEVDLGDIAEEAEEAADDAGGPVINPLTVTVIEEDGRWFPSLAFTIAETARRDLDRFGDGPSAPDLGDGVEPDGAESPEAAIQELLDAAVDADPEAAMALLDPGELGALQVYADALFGDLEAGESADIEAELTDAEVTDLGDGIHRVLPTGLVIDGDVDGDEVRVELADGCVTVEVELADPDEEDVDLELCGGDDFADTLPDELGDALGDVEVPEELSELVEAFQPIEFGVITVERDGEHYLSPVRTAFDLLAVSFRGLEREDLEEGGIVFELLTGGLDDEFEEFFAEIEDQLDEQFEEDFEDFEDFEEPSAPPRTPTGPTGSGPDGELLAGDVVEGTFAAGEEASFVLLGTEGDAIVGAESLDGGDLTITLVDVATGEELDFNDDFVGLDPEAFAVLEEGQRVLVTVADFGDTDPGRFVVYYET